jgi:hypothetical protein
MRKFEFAEEERVALVHAAQSTIRNLREIDWPTDPIESALRKLQSTQE